jgi:exopolysaccharide biosynthesis predicted pyruvyltransferase EpsI
MKQKKIAILTQPLVANYGGSLQNFALTQYLSNSGHKVKTINRVNKNPNSKFKILLSVYKNLILQRAFNKNVLTLSDQAKIFYNHRTFLLNNINLTEEIDNTQSLKKHFKKENYDVVIVGSDQTWRPKYSPNIYNYFFDFLENDNTIKKIAYAASFGTSDWEFSDEETQKCSNLLRQFDAVSVREKSGVELCEKYFKINANWVLDPTMLLTKEDYINVANQKQIPDRSGLFTYILDESEAVSKTINNIKSMLKVDSFTNQPVCRAKDCQGRKLEDLVYPSVEGWIKAFEQASFIITNSFHGTVFCIIFNKPFLTIAHKERGVSRFHSLLSEFKLENRLVFEEDVEIENIIKSPVDFTFANQRWEELKKESMEFLIDNLTK